MYIGKQIHHHALALPDKIAVIYNKKQITYSMLQEKVEQYRGELYCEALKDQKKGLLSVAIDVMQQDEQLYWFLAVTSLGWNGVLCHPNWSECDVIKMAKKATADVILSNRFQTAEADIPIWRMSSFATSDEKQAIPYAKGTELFYTGFTSGSTGEPKAFVRNHLSWSGSFDDVQQVFALSQSDRVCIPGLLFHSLFLFATIHTLHIGATVCLEQEFQVKQTKNTIEAFRVNVIYGVPTMLYALSQEGMDAQHVEKVIVSGAEWHETNRAQVKAIFNQATLYEFYGASELSFVSYLNHSNGKQLNAAVGELFPSVEVEVKRGGQLVVRSPYLFTGYVGQAPIGESFSVGDIGYFDEHHILHVKGRIGNMLTIGGHNVYPEETERVVKALPFVEEAVAVGTYHRYWGNQMVLFVQTAQAQEFALVQIKARLKECLPTLKRPRRIYVVEALPLLANGKVDRQALVGETR
ncbi:long-chain-fatty-acid--CoA ligase [Bacillus sp. JCM 19047]|nr:long-chain-fatty-acid--CoA ligase [Bacillus sp. JCM 19047]